MNKSQIFGGNRANGENIGRALTLTSHFMKVRTRARALGILVKQIVLGCQLPYCMIESRYFLFSFKKKTAHLFFVT